MSSSPSRADFQVARREITRSSDPGSLRAAGEVFDARRIIEPSGTFIDRAELDEHYDGEPLPGLRAQAELAIPNFALIVAQRAVGPSATLSGSDFSTG